MDPFRKGGKKRNTILKELEKYPYSFRMKDIGLIQTQAFENLRAHLESRLNNKVGYCTSVQTAFTRNLLAFALFQLGRHPLALKETDEVLKMNDQRNNVVSLANKAHMLCELKAFDDAEEVLDELRAIPEDDYLLVKAKAELAESYMRFGPRFNKHAADAFQEVLPHAKEPDIWSWRFALAITNRHALDLQHAPYLSRWQHTVSYNEVCQLLQSVIESQPGETAASKNLKANAYAEMGVLLHLAWDKTTQWQLGRQVQAGPLHCCKEALKLDNNDASVLWKSGKLFRYKRDLSEAKRLLEKAVELQPSSAAFHHLGLTYKAMVTNLQHGKKKTRRGGKREQRRKRAITSKLKHIHVDNSSVAYRGAVCGEVQHNGRVAGSAIPTQRSQLEERFMKAVKSPNHPRRFDPHEENVKQAIRNLKTAVEFSSSENSRAAYDLGLMYAATENFDEALQVFTGITLRQNDEVVTPSGLLEQITSLEQIGLIFEQKAEREQDEVEKKKMMKKKERKLNEALSLASELYSTTSMIKYIFGKIFQSPSALLKAAETSPCSEVDKQKMRANIFSLMNHHKRSFALLDDIAEKAQDADFYRIKIKTLARWEKYVEAVAILAYLKPTELYSAVKELLEEEDGAFSLFNIYLGAGKEVLLDGPCTAGYFSAAFRSVVQSPDSPAEADSTIACHGLNSTQGATVKDSELSQPGELWDVMLLHDEEDDDIERKATRLGDILKKACGLRVVRRSENFKVGSKDLGCLLQNMENSRMVVVLPGKEKPLGTFETCASAAAMRESTVVLLTEGVGREAIPRELQTPRHRSMICPSVLFDPDVDAEGPYTDKDGSNRQFISSICVLFRFLVNKW